MPEMPEKLKMPEMPDCRKCRNAVNVGNAGNAGTNLHSEKRSLTPLPDNIYFFQNGTRRLCRWLGGFGPILSEKIVRFCCIHQ
jgi:hypothetical protein